MSAFAMIVGILLSLTGMCCFFAVWSEPSAYASRRVPRMALFAIMWAVGLLVAVTGALI